MKVMEWKWESSNDNESPQMTMRVLKWQWEFLNENESTGI